METMSDIQLYLVEVTKDKDEARNLAAQSANRLARGELKLLQLIESCGEYINSDDAQLRKNSLSFLADVLSQLPPKVLSLQQRKLLCDFILSRVKDDSEGAGACAKALIALEERGKWDADTAGDIMETLVILIFELQVLVANEMLTVSLAILSHYETTSFKVIDSLFCNFWIYSSPNTAKVHIPKRDVTSLISEHY